jgi:hypothetical protein
MSNKKLTLDMSKYDLSKEKLTLNITKYDLEYVC